MQHSHAPPTPPCARGDTFKEAKRVSDTHLLASQGLAPVVVVTTSDPVGLFVSGWSQYCPVQPGWQ